MGHEIPRIMSQTVGIQNYHVNDPELKCYILFELEVILNTFSKMLKGFGLPAPLRELLDELENTLLMEEKNYNR
jgi:phage-related holin